MWIIYFIVYGLYSLLAIAGSLLQEQNRVLVALIVIQQPLLVLAAYCYTFRRRLLPGTVWNVVVGLSLLLWIISFLDVLFPSLGLFRYLTGAQRPSDFGDVTRTVLSFLFDLPALYAGYRLGKGVIRGSRNRVGRRTF
jgi:hypothetical protein